MKVAKEKLKEFISYVFDKSRKMKVEKVLGTNVTLFEK